MAFRRAFAIASISLVLAIAAYFGPSAYRKGQMDAEVDQLCAVDGGIKVYEQVSLPANRFDGFGDPDIPLASSKSASLSDYVLIAEVRVLVAGGHDGRGAPSLSRFVSKAIRVSDKKILGEAVGYYRFGGDPVGPWHPSSYTGCTYEPGKKLSRAVFAKAS